MKRAGAALLVCVATVTAGVSSAPAVTGGQLDGNGHPNVGLITFYQPDGRFRCSATLVSPTVLVTAAHCTDGVRGKVLARFDPVVPPLPTAADQDSDGNSQTGFTSAPPGWLAGTPHTHPLWDGELQLNDLHDVGVVVLDAPYFGAAPASLPPAGFLNQVAARKQGLSKQVFEVVGYGVFFEKGTEGPKKPAAVSDRTRRFTTLIGQNLTSQVLKLAENPKDSRAGGGTCFGDSGGPAFHGGYLVADTSFGASQFCRGGGGGYYRLDIADARNFLDDFVAVP